MLCVGCIRGMYVPLFRVSLFEVPLRSTKITVSAVGGGGGGGLMLIISFFRASRLD